MTRTIVIAAALALAVILPTESAQAQSPRTFVSAAGSDSNPCSFATPCRHFQAAVNATSAGGEVDALDPAGYGPITITQAITIEGQGWSYIAPPPGGNGIQVNAVSGNVYIHGVSLNGVGITGSTTGILFLSGGSLTIRDSVIRNFTSIGINSQPGVSGQLLVSSTLVSDNGGDGIFIFTGLGTLDTVTMEGNTGFGLDANSFGFSTVNVMVRNSTMTNNSAGLGSQGATTTVWLTRSTITGNASDFEQTSGAHLISYADNNIVGNTTSSGTPATIGYK
jgi:Right handed beta helix region